MKTLSYLIVLSIAITFFGCKNQKQTNQNKKEQTLSKSGEIVFGDKKVTYFIEGEGVPCMVCADGNIQANASKERKMIFETNKERLSKINIDSLPEIERAIMQYKVNVPMYWRDSVHDITSAFRNYRENTAGWSHFFTIMQDYDITRSEIKVPIFLSLGSYDFMVPQSLWDDYINKFNSLTVKRFAKSGHFPHVEEQELFDNKLLDWTKNK
jgi:hypothetical protein